MTRVHLVRHGRTASNRERRTMGWLDEGIEPGWVRAAAAVADPVEIRVMDYRKLTGERFDAVVSIGMVEHGGSVQIDLYAQQLAGLLEPEGRLLNHGIARVRHGDPEAAVLRALWVPERCAAAPLAGPGGARACRLRDRARRGLHRRLCRDPDPLANAPRGSHLEEAVRLAGERRVRVWGIYLRAARSGFQTVHVGVPSPRAFGLTDWRRWSPDEAGKPPSTKFYELRDNLPGSSTWG
jgi:cyclopropane-fatty-acyl-phospholipid synthase